MLIDAIVQFWVKLSDPHATGDVEYISTENVTLETGVPKQVTANVINPLSTACTYHWGIKIVEPESGLTNSGYCAYFVTSGSPPDPPTELLPENGCKLTNRTSVTISAHGHDPDPYAWLRFTFTDVINHRGFAQVWAYQPDATVNVDWELDSPYHGVYKWEVQIEGADSGGNVNYISTSPVQEFTINFIPTVGYYEPSGEFIQDVPVLLKVYNITDVDDELVTVKFYGKKANDMHYDQISIQTVNLQETDDATYLWKYTDSVVPLKYDSQYDWYVEVSDGLDTMQSVPMSFSTKPSDGGTINENTIIPNDNDINVPIDDPPFSVSINHPNGLDMRVQFWAKKSTDSEYTLFESFGDQVFSPGSVMSANWYYNLAGHTDYDWSVKLIDTEGVEKEYPPMNYLSEPRTFTTENNAPTVGMPVPNNNSIVSRRVNLSIMVNDEDVNDTPLKVEFFGKEEGASFELLVTQFCSNGGVSSYLWDIKKYGQKYFWYVIVSDANCNPIDSKNFNNSNSPWCFTTIENEVPNNPVLVLPANNAVNRPVTGTELSVLVSDPEEQDMSVTFKDYTNNNVIGLRESISNNSTTAVVWGNAFNQLSPHTEYKWYVEVEDTEGGIKRYPPINSYWSFTTLNHNPEFYNQEESIVPEHSSVISPSPTLGVLAGDPDGDNVNVRFYGKRVDQSVFNMLGNVEDISNGSWAYFDWEDANVLGVQYQWKALFNDAFGGQFETDVYDFRINNAPYMINYNVSPADLSTNLNPPIALGVRVFDPDATDNITITFKSYDSDLLDEEMDPVSSGTLVEYLWITDDSHEGETLKWYIVAVDNNSNEAIFPQNSRGYWEFTMNHRPAQPVDIIPVDQSTGVPGQPAVLSARIMDEDPTEVLSVKFYNESDEVIDEITGVRPDKVVTVNWEGLDKGTTYKWYLKVDDGNLIQRSPSEEGTYWEFTTTHIPNIPVVDTISPIPNTPEIKKSPHLQATFTHIDGIDIESVRFIDAETEAQIGEESSVLNNGTANVVWESATETSRPYYWYIEITDVQGGYRKTPIYMFAIHDEVKTIYGADQYSMKSIYGTLTTGVQSVSSMEFSKYVLRLAEDIVVHYPLDDNPLPTYGSEEITTTGNYFAGKINQGLSGSVMMQSETICSGNEFTISLWWNMLDNTTITLLDKENGTDGWKLTANKSTGKIAFTANGTSDGDIVFQEWNHLVVTRKNNNIRVYSNGVKRIDFETTINVSTALLKIGSVLEPIGIDEISVWDRQIDHLEASVLYNLNEGISGQNDY